MQRVTSKDGTTIAFDRIGSGVPIVLIGGAMSQRRDGETLASILAAHLNVITFDRRGRGDSGDTAPYSVQREVEDIDAVIRQVGGPAFLFGHSSGAILALESGAQSAAVKGVALYEPPFIVDDTRTPLAKDFVSRLSAFLSADRRGDAIELFMTEAVGVPREMVAQMRAGPMWAEMEKLAPTISYDVQISADFQRGKPLPANRWVAVTAPTLVMDGGSSPAWARNAVQALANTLPNARRRTLDGQTHGFDPAVLAPVLVEFFSPESRPPRVSQDGRASAQGPGAPQA